MLFYKNEQPAWHFQPNTQYDLSKRLHQDLPNTPTYDIRVRFNPWRLNNNSITILQQLPKIIKDSGDEGQEFELDIFEISIGEMIEHQEDNIVCDSN